MRIAILAAGTRGDLQPVVTIGSELVRRGHQVAVTVNQDMAGWVRRSGLETIPMGVDVGRFLNSDEGQRLLANGRFGALSRQIAEHDRAENGSIMAACTAAADGAGLVLSTLTMAYRGYATGIAAGVPSCTLAYWPIYPDPAWASVLSPVRDLPSGRLNRASFAAMHQLMWRQNRPTIDALCDRLGIPRFRRRPRFERGSTLLAYSPRLAPPPRRVPIGHTVVGPVRLPPALRARYDEHQVPADLRGWLDDGPPPVYFGFGSMPVLDPPALLAAVAEITARRGLRGLIGAGWSSYTDAGLPGHLYLARGEFDHEQVLPRCRAAVHHGGSGTTAAVLRAGLPSVVLSLFADQPFWGWRLAELGAGVTMPFRTLRPDRLGAALDQVLTGPYGDRATALGSFLRDEDGTSPAADAVEELAQTARENEPR